MKEKTNRFSCLTSNTRDEDSYYINETLFSMANGYAGVRAFFEEDRGRFPESIRGTYINGFYDTHPIVYGEKLYGFSETGETIVNITDAQSFELNFRGAPVKAPGWAMNSLNQELDLENGNYARTVQYQSAKGDVLELTITKFASLADKNVMVSRIAVTALRGSGILEIIHHIDGDVENFRSTKDPRLNAKVFKPLTVSENDMYRGIPLVSADTKETGYRVSAALILPGREYGYEKTASRCSLSCEAYLNEGESFRSDKIHLYCDSRRDENIRDIIDAYRGTSVRELEKRHRAVLKEFWDLNDIEIEGNDELNTGLRYNMYQLLQSASVDPVGNISAKGLSGEGYEGHYFWDTEIYMLPLFAFNNPERAKTLLRYRYNSLPAARERARALKHKKGVTFPWRMIEKHECSAFYPAGTAQYHINGDIAYAFVQYYLINGDREFLKECLAEVLIETARIWVDTGFFREGVFHINQVTGPNEYNCLQDDNYYTNAMARYNLRMAVKLCGELKGWDPAAYEELSARLALTDDELETFARAAEGMCLLYDEETGINPQDRGFLFREKWDFGNTPKENYPLLLHYHPMTLGRYQVCKQADTILAYYLLNDMEPEDVIRRSYEYYEKITTHDSSLSSCIFGILAGQLGRYGKAYDYFMESARLDLDNTHGNTKHGLHLANLGGSWIGVVHGFAGVRVYGDHLKIKPFLPAPLKAIRFKLKYRGSTIGFDMGPENTVLTLLDGPEAALAHGKNRFILKDKAKVATGRSEG